MGEASHAPHLSPGFSGVSSLPSMTTWATGGPSPRGCSRTTTRHLPQSTTKWYVRCWHRRGGLGGLQGQGGSQLRAPWLGWVRRSSFVGQRWAAPGRSGPLVSPVPPGPPWTPIWPVMPSLSPLGLFPWGWGEAGALPAPLPSSLPHFWLPLLLVPELRFPPKAWSWWGATSSYPCAAQSRRAGAAIAGGRSTNFHKLSMLPSILTSERCRGGKRSPKDGDLLLPGGREACWLWRAGRRAGSGVLQHVPSRPPRFGQRRLPLASPAQRSSHFCSLHLTALLLLLCVLCVRFLPHACWLLVG